MNDKKKYRVLLAIDPKESEQGPWESKLSWFKKWASEREVIVEAVFVSSGQAVNAAIAKFGFIEFVRNLNLGTDVEATILVEKSSSRKNAIQTLLKHAKQKEADLIVVSSHGRSGVGRLLMGSFAESLLASSSLPVLFLSEEATRSTPASKVLFATDFSAASKCALGQFLTQMKGYSGEVILFHVIPPPGAMADTGVLGIPLYVPTSEWKELKKSAEIEGEKMAAKVKSEGIRARVSIYDGLSTALAIQSYAQEENVDLIGMASMSHGLESLVVESVAQEVFRLKKWPVWVYGPETLLAKIPQSVTLFF